MFHVSELGVTEKLNDGAVFDPTTDAVVLTVPQVLAIYVLDG